MDKYRFRPAEAEDLASFLLSMLCWLPKDRASAQKMLDHPWLSMPDDYDTKMSDLEFKKYKLRQTFEGINHDFANGERQISARDAKAKRQAEYQEFCPGARVFEGSLSDLADEDSDINGGDDEDNVESELFNDSIETSTAKKEEGETSSSSDDSDEHSMSFTSAGNRG
jgi:serine/threonine protein kinase